MIALVYGYYVFHGGIGRYIAETLKRIRNIQKYQVLTLENTLDYPSQASISIIECVRENKYLSPLENLSFSSSVIKFIKDKDFDLVHSHGVYGFEPDLYTAHICFSSYFDSLIALYGQKVKNHLFTDIIAIERKMLKNLNEDQIFPVSRKVAIELAKNYSFDENKFNIARGASRFVSGSKKAKFNEQNQIIGSVGSNFYSKGFPILIEVMKELNKRGKNIELRIGGCDDKTDLILKDLLPKNVKIMDIEPLGKEFYINLDCFVCLSAYEGYSLSTIEAMSLGVPVVSSRMNGVFYDAYFINHRIKLAKIEDITNICEVSDVIERVLEDKTFRDEVINSGYNIASLTSWRQVAKFYKRTYGELG